jgi:cell division protein FtsB
LKLRWILATLFMIGAAYFALFGGDYGYFEVLRLERERRNEQSRLYQLQQELAQLRVHADSLERDPTAIERIARERYGLIREGERLYRFVDSAAAVQPRDSTRRTQRQ